MLVWTKDFYDSHKYAILWTVVYVIITWAIMQYMFNFNIFSALRWHQLMHSHLHGFAGLVFGILILAMVPLYVATTVMVMRKNEPLFNFKLTMPQIVKDAFVQPPMPEPAQTKTTTTTTTQTTTTDVVVETAPAAPAPNPEPKPEPVPDVLPAELRVAYSRAREHTTRAQTPAFDLGNVTKAAPPAPTPIKMVPEPASEPEPEMPIPTDFDIEETSNIVNDAPVFTTLNFDEDDANYDEEEPTPEITDIKTTTNDNDVVAKYLDTKSIPYKTDNEVIVTNKFAIVSHTDSDFWVADNESWFAAGKIRKSPIASVLNVASANKVQPVLYLGADNIMDIDDLRKQWQTSGILIITDLKDLI